MILATELQRVFILQDKGNEIKLTDPERNWSEQDVLFFYSNMYPILTTAKISSPVIQDDQIVYRFETVIGTKG
ncbi:PRTRC system protein C [Sphingobacterium sp. SRCM116780]|uniref:PRTRC system protein C n=1 Tax=Sphingobacterium sp. SRCM116780 TaxID=2907623 RepID=UPI001F16CF8E|nr:PRTRC system protein C [Sphingobacterium sp. SRCM116780]UIR57805.1 PRTRC system protein C [Sphingobacterium sp. SRCM116780]